MWNSYISLYTATGVDAESDIGGGATGEHSVTRQNDTAAGFPGISISDATRASNGFDTGASTDINYSQNDSTDGFTGDFLSEKRENALQSRKDINDKTHQPASAASPQHDDSIVSVNSGNVRDDTMKTGFEVRTRGTRLPGVDPGDCVRPGSTGSFPRLSRQASTSSLGSCTGVDTAESRRSGRLQRPSRALRLLRVLQNVAGGVPYYKGESVRSPRRTPCIHPMLDQCWASVADDGLALNQHWWMSRFLLGRLIWTSVFYIRHLPISLCYLLMSKYKCRAK